MSRIAVLVALLPAVPAVADEPFILLQSTTSTQNSGLYDHLLPLYRAAGGVEVRVVAVGTGQAIRNAKNCDGDVLLVHAREAEEAFVAAGHGVARTDLMYNDFVIVGPAEDPAGIRGLTGAAEALRRIAASEARFASRGDDSGTHKAERRLWQAAGIGVEAHSGRWYRETGAGMGATLNTAVAMGAYVLTDRATWISFGNKAGMQILVEGDPELFNQYGIILVSPTACPNARAREGQHFIDWLLSPAGQGAIAGFRVEGQQLFVPNAPSG